MPLIGQVSGVLIVDNGSSIEEQEETRALSDQAGFEVLWNGTNLGLAAALNAGLGWALDRGASWVLLLDQDSKPGPDVVAEAGRVLKSAGVPNVAAIGAGFVGSDRPTKSDDGDWTELEAVITSGMVVSIDAWQATGGFRPDFFVDYVDLEFCLRARRAGYRILRSLRPTIWHAIGQPSRRRFLWRSITVTNHSARRRYEITRNRVVVWRSFWLREPRFVAADAVAFVKELIKVTLYESERRLRLRAIIRGLRDGIFGMGQGRR
jgi:rhamnosyltransferase